MREQVIAARPSRRANAPSKGLSQRPMRRDGRAVKSSRFSARALLGFVPRVLKVGVLVLAIIGLAIGYRAASSASLFQIRAVDVVGTSRTSADEIAGLVRRAVSKSGVWRADLPALSMDLGHLPGVRRAVVTRVLPDRLRVRITERVPFAVVRTSSGHFVWFDDEAVALGEMKSSDQTPPFFILGVNEDGTEEAGQDNIERLKKYQEALREWQAAGLTERISEINLFDVHDVRVQLAGEDSQIEVRLGSQDLGRRLQTSLDVLDEYKQTPRGPFITYVDFQGDRVVLGFTSGGKMLAETENANAAPDEASTSANNTAAPGTASLVRNKTDLKPTNKKPNARPADKTSTGKDRSRGR